MHLITDFILIRRLHTFAAKLYKPEVNFAKALPTNRSLEELLITIENAHIVNEKRKRTIFSTFSGASAHCPNNRSGSCIGLCGSTDLVLWRSNHDTDGPEHAIRINPIQRDAWIGRL